MTNVCCVIPTHGRSELLRDAVLSVLRQSDPPSEIVVVDDLGDAAPPQSSKSTMVRLLTRNGTPGASASRNFGAASTSADVLAFLDDDDLWQPDYLHEALGLMASRAVDFVVSGSQVIDVTKDKVIPGRNMREGQSAGDVVGRNPGMTGSNFIVKASVFREVGGFDPELRVSNDKDLLVRLLLARHTYAVNPKRLVTHRDHGGPQLTDRSAARADGLMRYMAKHRTLLTYRDKRYIYNQVFAIRRRSSTSIAGTALYAGLHAATVSSAQLHERLLRIRGARSGADASKV